MNRKERLGFLAKKLNKYNKEWMYLQMCDIVELFSDKDFVGVETLDNNAEWKSYIIDNESGYLQVRVYGWSGDINEELEEYDYECFEDFEEGINYLKELRDSFKQ